MSALLQDIVALLAISNPSGALPVFLAITDSMTPRSRARSAGNALLAGPGTITTVLTLAARVATWRDTMLLLLAVVTVGATIGITLASAARLGHLIGARGQRILLRFMGLILAAVGAEILLAGVYTFVPRSEGRVR